MLLQIISLQRKKLLISLATAAGVGAVFLAIVQCVMMSHPDPQSTPVVVQMLVGGMGGFLLFFNGMMDTYQFLPMSIRMGQTRKKMLLNLFLMHLLLAVVIYIMGFILGQLEWFLTQNVWIPMVDGLIIEDISTEFAWWATAAMPMGGLLVGYFAGAVFARFGQKIGGYFLIGLWISFIALQNGMIFDEISLMNYIPPVAWGVGLVAVIIWIVHSFLTMSVGSE